jgi:DNA-binding response OmpR family regulator
MAPATDAPRALIVDADPALFGLLEEWLAAQGFGVARDAEACGAPDGYDLIVADVPAPRSGGLALLRRLSEDHPGTPILALSSSFFAGIDTMGAVARSLGVAGVLPKPVTREALLLTVDRVLGKAA